MRPGLRNPVRVVVKVTDVRDNNTQATPQSLINYYTMCETKDKLRVLEKFLLTWAPGKKVMG